MHYTFKSDARSGTPAGDRRATRLALAHWQASCRDDPMPTLMDLGLSAGQIISSSWFLLKEDPDPRRSVFLTCGARAQEALAREAKGMSLAEAAPAAIREVLCGACVEAVNWQAPFEANGTYESVVGDEIRYRSIFMPVAASGGGRYVVGVYRSRPARPTERARSGTGYVFGAFSVETSNGGIEFEGELAPGGVSDLRTSNGSISVKLAGQPNVRVDATTSNGTIVSRLPLDTATTEKHRLRGTIGKGEADLSVRTSNGSVNIE